MTFCYKRFTVVVLYTRADEEIPTKPPVRVTGPSGSMDATLGTSRVPDKQIGYVST